MRHLIKMALLAGTALAAAGCNRQAPVNNVANEVGQTEDQTKAGNDASAVESVNTAPEPPREAPPANDSSTDDPGAENPGGDTGGNTMDVNTNTPGI